jgi:hypothetical protein
MSERRHPGDAIVWDDETIEHLLDRGGQEEPETNSLARFCAHLARVAPPTDPVFERQLEVRLVTEWERRRRDDGTAAATPVAPSRHRPFGAAIAAPWRRAPGRIGALAALAGVAAILLLLIGPIFLERDPILTPRLLNREQLDALLNSASAAPPSIPAGQVLHCTIRTTISPGYVYEVWLDPERGLARAETRDPKQPAESVEGLIGRSVFDGRVFTSYKPGYRKSPGVPYTYEQAAASFPKCSLADELAELKRQIRPEWPVTTTEETLEGVPVIVVRFLMDVRTSPKVISGARTEPGRTPEALPAQYTFTHDEHRLIAVQTWAIAGDELGGPTRLEYRVTYTLAPAGQYPPPFFSADIVSQP